MVSGGGEPLAAQTLAGWRDRFGLDLYEGFGTNGMMHVFVTTAVTRTIKPGSMGTPLPGYECRVIRADGAGASVGEPGQLEVRGPVGTTFWGHPDAAAEVAARQRAVVHDGWVRVGDWVRRDAEGHLSFVARDEDLVVRDGETFGPLEVERVLVEHPAVAEVGVHSLPPRGDDSRPLLRALVVPAPGGGDPTADLLAYARSRLPAAG